MWQVYETCWPMVVHSLGAVVERHQMYNVREVYAQSSCSVPVVFLLPAADQPAELSSMAGSHCYMTDDNLTCNRLSMYH